jgi:hypothetical protein
MILAAAAAPIVVLVVAAPASADPGDLEPVNFTVSPAVAAPGSTVTVTASWRATAGNTEADLSITLPSGLAGVAAWAATPPASLSEPLVFPECVTDGTSQEIVACLWGPVVDGVTATMKAELTLPAGTPLGTYDLLAQGTFSLANQTATLTVGNPPPTPGPTAPVTTPAITSVGETPAPSIPVPTAVPAGEGPSADSAAPNAAGWVLFAAVLGVISVVLRRRWHLGVNRGGVDGSQ